MNDIFNRLNEIESAAASILEQANAKKRQMSDETNRKMAQFDEETERSTQESIEKLKETLNLQAAAELEHQKAGTQKLLSKITQEYEEHHAELAKQILSALIKE